MNEANKWQEELAGLPEYNNINQPDPEVTATFKFRNQEDFQQFKSLVSEHLYNGGKVFDGMQKIDAKNAWFPHKQKASQYICSSDDPKNPRFPVYIVSKGRAKRNPTSKALKQMGVPFTFIVEEQDYEDYLEIAEGNKVLILPEKYKQNYDTFWKDDDPRTGAGAARNFAWDHSIENGYDWHWVLDDNIEAFERFENNMKVKCLDGTPFYIIEDFVLRYENIGQAGFGYSIFCPASECRPALRFNTRIYSSLLIRNDIPYRWRGRYNEDTDLSLRILKDGLCTVEFNMFLQSKRATQTVKGGNTEEFYSGEGTTNKSQMLVDMHPDVCKLSNRWNRVHHYVDYSQFKKNNKLQKKLNIDLPNEVNNFGLTISKK